MTKGPRPQLFYWSRDGGGAIGLGLLMLAAALTEGLGIVLLVPMLALLGGASEGGTIARVLAGMGIPQRLDVLLCLFVALAALRALLTHARSQASVRFEVSLVDALRSRAWHAVLNCEWRTLSEMRRADTASLLLTEIDRSAIAVNQAIQAIAQAVTLGGIALTALVISPKTSLGAVLGGILVMLAYRGLRQRAGRLGTALGFAWSRVHGQLQEALSALRVIKSTGSEAQSAAIVLGEFAALRDARLAYIRDQSRGQAVLQIGGALVLALLVWISVTRWQVDMAHLLPLVALFARALPLLGALQQSLSEWAHARPAVNAALAMTATAEAAREPDGAIPNPPELTRQLAFVAVSVQFGNAPASLSQVSLTILARGITAVIGASGAGKSTLADLAGGLLSPDAGTVTIDGQALEGPLRRAWRTRVAYVQQDPVLRAASVRDNLLWAAPEASDEDLRKALEDAAASFVFALPDGLGTRIGDGGRVLSGGERQRLMLARALLRAPALLILDEATSALDAATEALIAAALGRLKTRMAVLVIAHRGALTDLADRTYTLAGGKLVS